MEDSQSPSIGWLEQLLEFRSWRKFEILLVVLLILVALVTRFYDLEARVMSHDESEHTYFSWFLSEHGSYQHTPITHGPLQFHMLAITYKILGDTDATSRFPAAAAGVLAIALILLMRRWLGRTGTLLAMVFMINNLDVRRGYTLLRISRESLVIPLGRISHYSLPDQRDGLHLYR